MQFGLLQYDNNVGDKVVKSLYYTKPRSVPSFAHYIQFLTANYFTVSVFLMELGYNFLIKKKP